MCASLFPSRALLLIVEQCVARKVPELCKAYTPGKGDQDVGARLARLEHIIEMALPQYCVPTTPGASSYDLHNHGDYRNSDEDNRSEDQDPSGGTFQSGKWYGNSASGSIAPGSIIEQVRALAFCCPQNGLLTSFSCNKHYPAIPLARMSSYIVTAASVDHPHPT